MKRKGCPLKGLKRVLGLRTMPSGLAVTYIDHPSCESAPNVGRGIRDDSGSTARQTFKLGFPLRCRSGPVPFVLCPRGNFSNRLGPPFTGVDGGMVIG